MKADWPIGVFDSGVGGLTVLRALRDRLPTEHFVYLGDTARLPYGTKSRESIERYALQAARLLASHNVKCLVIACNTASAIALDVLRRELAPLPIIGVVEPGAKAGCAVTKSGRIAVVATESTVRGGAYEQAIKTCRPDAVISTRACPLFVALAEEGLTTGPIVEAVAHHYLDGMFSGANRPDTLVLGCTHFPVLAGSIARVIGGEVSIVDSALTTAASLENELRRAALQNESVGRVGSVRLLATDGRERFASVGSIFLGAALRPEDVEIVDLV
jgi:glutamate racemase